LIARFHAAKITCDVAPALLDGEIEGSFAIPAMQRVSFETAGARAACEQWRYMPLPAMFALLSTRKRVVSRCPFFEDHLNGFKQLINKLEKLNGAAACNRLQVAIVRLHVCAAPHEKTSDFKMSLT
jgi:hypothetical protein